MVGIKRLAKHLNVSISTVSRALNGRPDSSEEMRKRVLAAANELGYVANQSGRSLRQGTTNAIGFVMELIPDIASNADSFFMGVFEGVKQSLASHDLDLVVLPSSVREDSVEYVRRIVRRRLVDGIIISGTQRYDKRIELLQQIGIPFVTLGRSETKGDYGWIDLDFEDYVRVSVERLVGFGHRRIAIAVPNSAINLRYVVTRAYQRSMKSVGLEPRAELVIPAESSEAGGYTVADTVLDMKDPPSAVILSYELMAVGLYHRLNERRLLPGRDLAVIGLRESPQSRALVPRLTCFSVGLVDLGAALGHSLLLSMPGFAAGYKSQTSRRLWPLSLVPGESDTHAPAGAWATG